MRRALIAILALGLGASGPALGQQLGRLFFTPEQRDALDARRKARLPDIELLQKIQADYTHFLLSKMLLMI